MRTQGKETKTLSEYKFTTYYTTKHTEKQGIIHEQFCG